MTGKSAELLCRTHSEYGLDWYRSLGFIREFAEFMQTMSGNDWKAILALIPADQVGSFVLSLFGGSEICLDTIVRIDEKYLVVRGRMSGQIEEGRAFFVPLDKINYLRWEKVVKLDELRGLFNDNNVDLADERAGELEAAPPTELLPRPPLPPLQPSPDSPTPLSNTNARNNLLERIRAARASTAR